METLFIEGKQITTKEELHRFVKNKLENQYNIKLEEVSQDDLYRGKKKKPLDAGPQKVYLKYMFPYKIDINGGCKQMILGVLVDSSGRPVKNPIIEFTLSDYSLGTMTFSPAISFGDGSFFTTFISECCGTGCLTITARGTDLNKVIPINVCNYGCY
ncbi:MAG: hypothetical protein ACRDA3_12325 [Peptostreptococcaceae bacterium]